jgi:hypothetical protein
VRVHPLLGHHDVVQSGYRPANHDVVRELALGLVARAEPRHLRRLGELSVAASGVDHRAGLRHGLRRRHRGVRVAMRSSRLVRAIEESSF